MPASLFPDFESKPVPEFRQPTPPITRLTPTEIVELFSTKSRRGGIPVEIPDPRIFLRRVLPKPPSPVEVWRQLRQVIASGGFMI